MVESSNIVDVGFVWVGTKKGRDAIKSKCRLSTFEGDTCPYVEKAKEEGRLQGAKEVYEDILNKMLGESTYPITIGYVKTKLKELE